MNNLSLIFILMPSYDDVDDADGDDDHVQFVQFAAHFPKCVHIVICRMYCQYNYCIECRPELNVINEAIK